MNMDQSLVAGRQWWLSVVIVLTLLALSILPPELEGNRTAGATYQAVATPAASPVAAGCGNDASSPTEIAEVFVAAAAAMNLERAALCFAPHSQPASWGDVFLGGGSDAWDDLSGCQGRPYTVLESRIRPRRSAIIFTFDRACVIASLDPWQRDLYDDAETLPVTTVVVQTGYDENRWYVLDAFALVPD
jgi:hypothetical protein